MYKYSSRAPLDYVDVTLQNIQPGNWFEIHSNVGTGMSSAQVRIINPYTIKGKTETFLPATNVIIDQGDSRKLVAISDSELQIVVNA